MLSPFEVRVEKSFRGYRSKPLLAGFCNLFERNLAAVLDQQSYVWGDAFRINTKLIQAIEASTLSEDDKNHAVFWLILFHTSYFVMGYQNKVIKLQGALRQEQHPIFTQATLQHIAALNVLQPANAPFWQENGYTFHPVLAVEASANVEHDIRDAINAGATLITSTPLLQTTELNAALGQLNSFQAQTYETFAKDMLNDWVAEFSKSNDFGDMGINGIRLLYFKAKPPRDASEAIMDCLRSRYPVTDDVALYNNKRMANDYFAPRKADPIEEKTGHVELFVDCSGSISAGDIGDMLKIFTDFFAKRKKKMTYGLNCFDTSILSRITVGEDEDPVAKIQELAIVGGGGTDFRCTAADIQAKGEADSKYKCDLAVVCTDMAGTFPDTVPCDYVWVTTTKDCNLGAVTSVNIPGTVIYL